MSLGGNPSARPIGWNTLLPNDDNELTMAPLPACIPALFRRCASRAAFAPGVSIDNLLELPDQLHMPQPGRTMLEHNGYEHNPLAIGMHQGAQPTRI